MTRRADQSTQNSRVQSPLPTPHTQVNFWHRHPYFTGGLAGAGTAIPLTLLAHYYRAPIGKFIYNVGNYMKRAGYNAFDAVRNTPFKQSANEPVSSAANDADYKRNHVNTANEKQY